MQRRLYSATRLLHSSHENPLGLPKTGTPPTWASRKARGLPEARHIQGVKKVIAVSSAKGGVGKSTIAGMSSVVDSRLGARMSLRQTK